MMPNTFKRILCAVMALVLMVALLPAAAVTAEAAGTAESVVFFSDLHSSASDAKLKLVEDTFSAVANSVSAPVSAVFSVGDAFSSNYSQDIADLSDLTTSIRKGLSNTSAHVDYVWSDHDRYGGVNNYTGLVYGAGGDNTYGTDDDGNYYVYFISMSDMTSEPRYGTTSTFSTAKLDAFVDATDTLDKSKPLFIVSHMPLLENRNDNNNAYAWYLKIYEVAKEMDVIFLHGHNHYYDKEGEYYYAKDSYMNVAGDNSSNELPLNFTHITAGYLDPATTGYAGNSRQKTVIAATITDDSIQLTTYCATGKYTAAHAVDVSVIRDHAMKHYYIVIPTATCTEGGYNIHLCTDCGDSYLGDFVEALGHAYSVQVVAPTCYKDGYSIYTCDTCGDSYHGDEVDALTHEYVAVVTPPTCSNEGYTTYKCKFCTSQYEDNFVDALDHNYTTVLNAPTCTTIGFTSYICQDCGHRYNDNYVSALGHNYEAEVVAPTCTEQGYTKHTCANCGDYYKDTYVAAPGHTSTVTVIAPTCTEQGYTKYTCQNCDDVTLGNYVAEKGHIYNCVQSGNLLTYSCKNCTYSYSVATESEYSYNKVTKLANNNTYVITMYVNKQYYALSHKDNKISAVPVTVANNKVMASDVTADILWNCKSNKLCYTYNGMTRYLNASSSRLSLSSTGATVSFSSSKLKVGSTYLRYANGSVSLNNTASTTYLFNQVEN